MNADCIAKAFQILGAETIGQKLAYREQLLGQIRSVVKHGKHLKLSYRMPDDSEELDFIKALDAWQQLARIQLEEMKGG